jgi:hypothetical protein
MHNDTCNIAFSFFPSFKTIVMEWELVQQRKEENQKERGNGRHDERRRRWVINKRGLSMEECSILQNFFHCDFMSSPLLLPFV